MSTPLPNHCTDRATEQLRWQPSFCDRSASTTEDAIIDLLGSVGFATREQLARYLGDCADRIRRPLDRLKSRRLIEVYQAHRPFAYALAARGLALLTIRRSSRISLRVIHQHLLRNAIELTMQQKNPTAHFLSRADCLKQGLNPSVREHSVVYQQDRQPAQALVLIDDDAMSPSRIRHALTRRHDPKRKLPNRGYAVERWQEAVGLCLVYATTDKQVKRHKTYIRQYGDGIATPTMVRWMPSVWERL